MHMQHDAERPKRVDGDSPEPSILQEAHSLINGDREKDYGHPRENYTRVALLWNAHLRGRGFDVDLSPDDCVWMMMQVKQARHMAGYKRDTVVDAAGYIGLVDRLREGDQ